MLIVKIIDSIMGSGKTSYAIQMIAENPTKKYIYITPYLDEVARIKNCCAGFVEPEEDTKTKEFKLSSFNRLLNEGKNIASTHNLFKLSTEQTIQALKKWGYTLIIDEVMEVVSHRDISKNDLRMILDSGNAHIEEETGFLIWDNDSYKGKLDEIKILCKTKSIVIVDNTALVWVFPAMIFSHFQEVYVLTYMFDAQQHRYYFDMNSITYEYYSVRKKDSQYILIEYENGNEDKSKIEIVIAMGKKNNIGTEKVKARESPYCYLSKSWYRRASNEQLQRLKNNIYGYFYNDLKSPSDLNAWTTFKDWQTVLQGKGYTEGFISCNARAVNCYKHKTAVAYSINMFMNHIVVRYFSMNGIKITKPQQEKYALSELLQFLFRTAIREGKPIDLYIPSVRMRHLLQRWLGKYTTN